jgi:two-component system, sensor histidine kinase RegB
MRVPQSQMATVEAPATPPVPQHATPLGETRVGRARLNLSWIVQLHWWAILGQVVIVVGASSWTHIGVPLVPLLAMLVLEVGGNLALRAWAQHASPNATSASVAAVMFLDAAVLTVLLDLTGGASNPFSTLYLVNVALGAVLLPPRWSWTLMVASLAGFASLYFHEEATSPAHHIRTHMDPAQMMDSHLRGMWVAFAIASVFIVFFVQRVSRALSARERELQQARALVERREKLASLATLAAGAAHELSTPLSTIAVVAKELQRSLPEDVPAEVRGDLQLVREQVGRCRDILDRMSANAGEHAGEPLAPMSVRVWVETALDGLPARERVELAPEEGSLDARLVGPPRALGDALRGLLKNGIQASPPDERVMLRLAATEGWVRARVVDRGRGMTTDVLRRVGEPFFTTKSPGEGMGLGLFLTLALVEQLGGSFQITSRPGAGTEACIDLPAAEAAERSGT